MVSKQPQKLVFVKNSVESMKRRNLRRHYDLSLEQYEAMKVSQKGLCQICQVDPAPKELVVDHDHATGQVRGLLCSCCNFGLGNFKDDLNALESAITYLKERQEDS